MHEARAPPRVLADQAAYQLTRIGWSYATHIRTEMIVDAIDMAIETRRPPRGLIHPSDQGFLSRETPAVNNPCRFRILRKCL